MISLAKAKKALEISEEKAKALGIAVTTVVVDTHGSVIAASRMDGALNISPQFAYQKAYTSARLGFPSGAIAENAKEGKPYFGITSLLGGKITSLAGGVPVKVGDKLVGGVGVGGSYDTSQDEACAQEAARVLMA